MQAEQTSAYNEALILCECFVVLVRGGVKTLCEDLPPNTAPREQYKRAQS